MQHYYKLNLPFVDDMRNERESNEFLHLEAIFHI